MDLKEALEKINSTTDHRVEATAIVIGANMIADALNRNAAVQERMVKIQERAYGVTAGMSEKVGTMLDKSLEMMKKEEEGDEWKNGGPQDDVEN